MGESDCPTPVVFCIDVEPDFRTVVSGRASAWDSFPEFIDYLKPLRDLSAEPQHFNWFIRLDAQTQALFGDAAWPLKHFEQQLSALVACGDEVGLHTHAFRQHAETQAWMTDHADQAWVEYCVRLGVSAFQGQYGHPPRCFRFGDHWMNNQTVALLESLGVKYDVTVEPGWEGMQKLRQNETCTGTLPDYRTAPLFPYQPSAEDYLSPGEAPRDFWMLPITSAPLKPSGFAICNIGCGPEQIAAALDTAFEEYPLVVVVGRTGDYPVLCDHYHANLEHLRAKMLNGRGRFVSAPEAVSILRQAGEETGAVTEVRRASDMQTRLPYAFDAGFYPAEGSHRWMSQRGAIEIPGQQLPATLHLEIARGDAQLYRKLPVHVTISRNGSVVKKLKLTSRRHVASLSLRLPENGKDAHISFTCNESFTPGATDPRNLSVLFRRVELK